jgi:hypothetical protein
VAFGIIDSLQRTINVPRAAANKGFYLDMQRMTAFEGEYFGRYQRPQLLGARFILELPWKAPIDASGREMHDS